MLRKMKNPFGQKMKITTFCCKILDWKKNSNKLRWQEDTYQFGWKENTTDKRSSRKRGEKETKHEPVKREASLLDFLSEDTTRKKKEEPKRKLLVQDPQESQEREESIRDDILGDKINRAKQRQNNRDGSNGDTKTDSRKQRDEDKVIPDDSSLCEEFDKDPLGRSFAEPVKEAK